MLKECWHCHRSEIEKAIVGLCDCYEDACGPCIHVCEKERHDDGEDFAGFEGEMAEELE